MTDPSNDTQEPTLDEIARGLFFIVGTGRCGTTLLQAMLNAHPRLHIPPETHFYARLEPSRLVGSASLSSPSLVDRYIRRVTRSPRWSELGIDPARLRAVIDGGATDASGLLPWFVRELSRGSSAPRFGEKTPRHAFFVGRILRDLPNAKFIHIHRDPRDVVYSMKSKSWSSRHSGYMSAKRCRDVYRRMREASATRSSQVVEISYERLVHEPEAVLRGLCTFLGEPFDDRMLRYDEFDSAAYQPREESWKGLARRPLDATRIGRYRGELSPREIRVVESVVGADLTWLGYEPEPGVPPMSARLRATMNLERIVGSADNAVRSMTGKILGRRW